MNQQPIESRVQGDGSVLDLHSVFLTLQGEGPFSGERAIFIRLAGCNLQCPGCDTEYTKGRASVPVEDLVTQVARLDFSGRVLVVITGGEPLRQSIGRLVVLLILANYRVQIETNGTLPPDRALLELLENRHPALTLVVSPKTKNINHACRTWAHAFKYVVEARAVADDGLPTYALEHERGGGVARPITGAVPVYLSPYDAKDEAENRLNRLAVAASCLQHGYRAGVQLHKYLELE